MPEFPSKPVRLLTLSTGTSVDFVARLIAHGLSTTLGQSIIVDNRDDLEAVALLKQAPPDGYTLLHFGGQLWTAPLLQKVSYDPTKDLSPITMAISQPNVLVAHPTLDANSVEELIALARKKPGQLKYASGINAASSQLSAELFNHLAGVRIAGVSYSEAGQQAVKDLIAGKVDIMIFGAGSAIPHVKAGRLKALAITSAKPSELFPGWPTVAATVPGYEAVHDEAVYAPAETPEPIIERWNQEIRRALTTPDARRQLTQKGMEAACGTPLELAAKGRESMARWEAVIKSAGIKAN